MHIGGEPIGHDAHDNHGRDPNEGIGGQEEGRKPTSAERHVGGWLLIFSFRGRVKVRCDWVGCFLE